MNTVKDSSIANTMFQLEFQTTLQLSDILVWTAECPHLELKSIFSKGQIEYFVEVTDALQGYIPENSPELLENMPTKEALGALNNRKDFKTDLKEFLEGEDE